MVERSTAGGDDAVALVGQLEPNLVLMDITGEGSMDGMAAAEAICRQHEVPVICLTAHFDPTH